MRARAEPDFERGRSFGTSRPLKFLDSTADGLVTADSSLLTTFGGQPARRRQVTMSDGGTLPWKTQRIDKSRGPGECIHVPRMLVRAIHSDGTRCHVLFRAIVLE